MAEEEEIARLKARLATLSGTARTLPLAELGKASLTAYWKTGPGSTRALPHLREAISATAEAHGYLTDPRDVMRAQTGAMLGVSRGINYFFHNGPASDGDAGIRLMEEALASGCLKPLLAEFVRGVLGQVYFRRALGSFQSHDSMMNAIGNGAPAASTDIDRAIDNFQLLLATAKQPQSVETARTLLRMAEPTRTLTGSMGSRSIPAMLAAMQDVMTAMQDVQSSGFAAGRFMPEASFFDFEWTADVDSARYPTAVVDGEAPRHRPSERREPRERRFFAVDVDGMRHELLDLLGAKDDAYARVCVLLDAEEPPERIDEIVALAAGVVDESDPAAALDHFLLSAALHLRDRRDRTSVSGQLEETYETGDEDAATASLLAAAATIVDQEPDGIPALFHLASRLQTDRSLDALNKCVGGLTTLLRTVGAEALYLPGPAAELRWNAVTGRAESATSPAEARTVVVVGDNPPPAVLGQDDEPIISYVASLSQLKRLSKRQPRPIFERPVFVANPRGDRESAAIGTMIIRRTFYPTSIGVGRLLENSTGAGTADELRTLLSEASILHLDCGVTATGALELANGEELDLTDVTVTHGGVAILPPNRFQPLADLLLAAGYTGVIGWRRSPVPPVAALATFVLHAELADRGRTPAEAVSEARRWFRHPNREPLPQLLAGHVDQLAGAEEWKSLVYRGR